MDYTSAILLQYTLPQINATLFPLIIILRKPSLKKKYKEFLLKVLLLPVRMTRKLLRRGEGYEALVEEEIQAA